LSSLCSLRDLRSATCSRRGLEAATAIEPAQTAAINDARPGGRIAEGRKQASRVFVVITTVIPSAGAAIASVRVYYQKLQPSPQPLVEVLASRRRRSP